MLTLNMTKGSCSLKFSLWHRGGGGVFYTKEPTHLVVCILNVSFIVYELVPNSLGAAMCCSIGEFYSFWYDGDMSLAFSTIDKYNLGTHATHNHHWLHRIQWNKDVLLFLKEAKIPLTDEQIELLINTLDQDGDGEIDFRWAIMENPLH